MNRFSKMTSIAVAMAVLPFGVASADSVSDFYEGRTITFYSGGSAGGGFSTVARLVAQHMADRIPGKPKMVVEARPGAGGAKMMSFMANDSICRECFQRFTRPSPNAHDTGPAHDLQVKNAQLSTRACVKFLCRGRVPAQHQPCTDTSSLCDRPVM